MSAWQDRLDRMHLNSKLLLGFGLTLALVLVAGVYSLHLMAQVAADAQELYEHEVLGISHVKDANINLICMSRALRGMVMATTLDERIKAEQAIGKAEQALRSELLEARKHIYSDENRRTLDQFDASFEHYLRNVDHTVRLVNQYDKFAASAAAEYLQGTKNLQVLTATDDLLAALSRGKEASARLAAQRIAEHAHAAKLAELELLMLLLAVGGATSFLLSRSILTPLQALRATVGHIAEGETAAKVPYLEYTNELGQLAHAVEALRDRAHELGQVRWVKLAAQRVLEAVQNTDNYQSFGNVLLKELACACEFQVGVFFVSDHTGHRYNLVASRGYRERKEVMTSFAPGQGLVGQCILEKTPIRVTRVPSDYIWVSSGLGHASPSFIEVVPVVSPAHEVVAVLEIAGFTSLSERETSLIAELMLRLALTLEVMVRNQRALELLAETQRQAGVLQASEDELSQQNDELQVQTAELIRQKEELIDVQGQLEARTHELEVARAKAEQATATKSIFLAHMSHEIRTPMNAIIGLSQLAAQGEPSPKQRDYLSKIHGAGQLLLGIINDILDFSKVESGHMTLEHTPFWLDEVFDNVATVIGQKAVDKSLEFLIHLEPGTPQGLVGDPLRLGQVLTNLVSNAVKFTEAGQVVLGVRLGAQRQDSVQLLFSVEDTGIGMRPEVCERLFEAFEQADSSISRKYGGSGLGLSICQQLVTLMGGEIEVETELKRGSVFRFDAWFDVASERPRRAAPVAVQGLRALVVDDNPVAAEILSEQLSSLGMRVTTVSSGQACLAALGQSDNNDPYRLVFLDWRMPEMDGVAATRTICRELALQHPPVVVMVTVFGSEDVRQAGLEAGATSFLNKPVNQSQLIDVISGILAPELMERAHVASQGSAHRRSVRGVSVLLVEDNEINQQIAVELLESGGAHVTLARNGREALDHLLPAADALPWSLVLMDLQMPVMDGYAATREIRRCAQLADLPVVAMTAHALLDERQRCLDEGMSDHIAKPIDADALYRTVALWSQQPAKMGWRVPLLGAGIAVHAGLARASGNEALYRNLLKRFARDYAHMAATTRAALGSGDTPTARRLLHTLKGVSGTLEAAPLAEATTLAERALIDQADSATVQERLDRVEALLSTTVAAILTSTEADPHAGGAHAAPATAAATASELAEAAELCATLDQLLVECDASCLALANAHMPLLRTALGASASATLARCLEAFDFEAARQVLTAFEPMTDRAGPSTY